MSIGSMGFFFYLFYSLFFSFIYLLGNEEEQWWLGSVWRGSLKTHHYYSLFYLHIHPPKKTSRQPTSGLGLCVRWAFEEYTSSRALESTRPRILYHLILNFGKRLMSYYAVFRSVPESPFPERFREATYPSATHPAELNGLFSIKETPLITGRGERAG